MSVKDDTPGTKKQELCYTKRQALKAKAMTYNI